MRPPPSPTALCPPSCLRGVLAFLGAQVREALAAVEAGGLLPPLVVLQTLARNPKLTLGTVRDYVGRQLARDGAALEADGAAIRRVFLSLLACFRVFCCVSDVSVVDGGARGLGAGLGDRDHHRPFPSFA